MEAGDQVGLLFVNNDCDFLGEVGQVRETRTCVSMAPGCDEEDGEDAPAG